MQRLACQFLFFFLLLLATNCTKESPFRSLVYTETKCSDAWKTNEGSSMNEVESALVDFLEQELKVTNSVVTISFDENEALDCEACSCTTGRIITVEVAEGFVPILEDNGFKLVD